MIDQKPGWLGAQRFLWGASLLPAIISLAVSQLVLHTGWSIMWWFGPIFIFGIGSIIDAVVGDDDRNPPPEEAKDLSEDKFYRWCTYAYLPLSIGGLVVAGALWADPALSVMDKIGLAFTVGVSAGISINVAHELGHRVEPVERWLSKLAVAQTFYGHFYCEHSRGHHVHVATPDDPVSARYGENYWRFALRSSIGGAIFGIKAETERLKRKNQRWFSIHNNLLHGWAMSLVLFGALIAAFGWQIAPYLALQAWIGVYLLEAINYCEHYGLLRQQRPDGRYERVRPVHAWNSNRLITNLSLFQLQRHSDHHANPGKRYQLLLSNEEAPQLPAGYATMAVVALAPPLWRWIMDRRVLAHYDGDLSRANLTPKLRKRLATV